MPQPVDAGSTLLAGDTHAVGRDLAEEVRAPAEPPQVDHRVSGYLVRDVFPTPRDLRDHLEIFAELQEAR